MYNQFVAAAAVLSISNSLAFILPIVTKGGTIALPDFTDDDTPPRVQLDFDRLAGKVPLLLINTQYFEWDDLRRLRNLFLEARRQAQLDEQPLVTQLLTIKVIT